MVSAVKIKEIWQEDEKILSIIWSDQKRSNLDVVKLRSLCPCASCLKDKDSLEIKLKKYEDTRPKQIKSVGKYAISISFDDEHTTGIFSFNYLRNL